MLKDLTAVGTAGAVLSTLLSAAPPALDHGTLLGSNFDVLVTWFIAITVAVSIGIPGTMIAASIASGAVFGLWVGTGLVAVSAVLGSIVSFALVRKLAKPWVTLKFSKHLDRVQAGFSRAGIWYLLTARLVGIPFMAVNLCFALTKIKYPAFAVGSLLGSLPIILAYSAAGASLHSPPPALLAIFPVFAVALILLRYFLQRSGRSGLNAHEGA